MAFKWQRLTNLNFLHRNINEYGIQNLNRLLLIIMYIDRRVTVGKEQWKLKKKNSIISFTNYEGCSVLGAAAGWSLDHLEGIHNMSIEAPHRRLFISQHLKVKKCDHFKLLIVICSNCQTKSYIYNSKKVTWCWYWSPIFDLFGWNIILLIKWKH